MFFSHDALRPGQRQLAEAIREAIANREHMLAHAPTGLGKTAAALCPALEYALKNDKFVFFLTSRHTQHKIVLETLDMLNEKHNASIKCASVIGKKWMCAQDNVITMRSGDFAEYCKSLVQNDACDFYKNVRGKSNIKAKQALAELTGSASAERIVQEAKAHDCCPYELSLMLAETSQVVIADYFYAFNPHIRESFLNKIKKQLDKSILIVDEAHNLPNRIRDLLTSRLTSRGVRLAVQEAEKFSLDEIAPILNELQYLFDQLNNKLRNGEEQLLGRDLLLSPLERIKPFDEIVTMLRLAGDTVLAQQKRSFVNVLADFLEEWGTAGDAFARILSKEDQVMISTVCMDPAVLTRDVFKACHSSVLMSGTLNPIEMYRDVLGFDDVIARVFPSPFPERNRLCLVVPKTTTKYSARSPQQFANIAQVSSNIANAVPGCVMVFFPSYALRDQVAERFMPLYQHTTFLEVPGLSKEQKQELLTKFSSYREQGAALLAVAAGSFGEGIDLPGVLKGVIVVGLPLDRPTLETKELINYYDRKFGKGWDYGYTLPAMTKCIQNAGRCIRTETDRGVLAFVDERYAWPRYMNCFPPDWDVKTTALFRSSVEEFFRNA